MKPLQPALRPREACSHPAKTVNILELAEEQDRVVDAVDAELERIHVVGPDLYGGLFPWGVGSATRKREIGPLFLAGEGQGKNEQDCRED